MRVVAREMTESALSTLRNGGNVLMPIDTAGRVFEIMLVLESKWHAEKLREQYPLGLEGCWLVDYVFPDRQASDGFDA